MRFLVMGAGGVGGVLGARLHEAGHEVVLVARNPHHDAIAASGLRVESPDGASVHSMPVVEHPSQVIPANEVILLTTKSQHSVDALDALVEAGFTRNPWCASKTGCATSVPRCAGSPMSTAAASCSRRRSSSRAWSRRTLRP